MSHESDLTIEVPPEQRSPEAAVEHPGEEVATPVEELKPVSASPPVVRACTHEAMIRNEAIRLAAVACGKALRHAALIHPYTIAAFVDEAMEAAGRAAEAIVVTSETVGEFGEVAVTFSEPGIRIGADLDTRAALLVRAAASE